MQILCNVPNNLSQLLEAKWKLLYTVYLINNLLLVKIFQFIQIKQITLKNSIPLGNFCLFWIFYLCIICNILVIIISFIDHNDCSTMVSPIYKEFFLG